MASSVTAFLTRGQIRSSYSLFKSITRRSLPCTTDLVFHRRCISQNGGEESDEIDEIEAKRDVSRLPRRLRARMRQVVIEPEFPNQTTRRHMRKEYARLGSASGVDPGIMWPTKQEFAEMIEDEKEWEPTLQQMWQNIDTKQAEINQRRRQKEELVERQMAKMPKLIKEFKAKITKEAEMEKKQAAKRTQLLEEAREYFGYDIDLHDPRIKEMQEMKEEEEKLAKKKKKKEEKQARHLASLQRMAAATTPAAQTKNQTQSPASEQKDSQTQSDTKEGEQTDAIKS